VKKQGRAGSGNEYYLADPPKKRAVYAAPTFIEKD
jgi:hypothetical protein